MSYANADAKGDAKGAQVSLNTPYVRYVMRHYDSASWEQLNNSDINSESDAKAFILKHEPESYGMIELYLWRDSLGLEASNAISKMERIEASNQWKKFLAHNAGAMPTAAQQAVISTKINKLFEMALDVLSDTVESRIEDMKILQVNPYDILEDERTEGLGVELGRQIFAVYPYFLVSVRLNNYRYPIGEQDPITISLKDQIKRIITDWDKLASHAPEQNPFAIITEMAAEEYIRLQIAFLMPPKPKLLPPKTNLIVIKK